MIAVGTQATTDSELLYHLYAFMENEMLKIIADWRASLAEEEE